MPTPYIHVELIGQLTSVPQENAAGNTWAWVLANGLSFKVVASGLTLEGFTPGDSLHVKGALRAGLNGISVINATVAETPPR